MINVDERIGNKDQENITFEDDDFLDDQDDNDFSLIKMCKIGVDKIKIEKVIELVYLENMFTRDEKE